MDKQVNKDHYNFSSYMAKTRWISVWHQLDEVLTQNPNSVLEVGPGPGVFKAIAGIFDVKVETLDLDPELKPDHVGSATDLSFPENSFDVGCAFQMLEHLPYDIALQAFKELVRVSSKRVIISLPDAKRVWRYSADIPKFGQIQLHFPRPFSKPKEHVFDGEHYWELNKKGYSLEKVVDDLCLSADLLKTWRVHENPYHRFFVFSKKMNT